MKTLLIGSILLFSAFGSSLWGQTPTFESLRQQAPGIALGLGTLHGTNEPNILTDGPLWKGHDRQVETNARWHVGSITKSMTSTLVMRQADLGTVDIDAPIGTYLTRFDGIHTDWQALTLRQLMSHTSGLRPNPSIKHLSQLRTLDPVEGRHRVLSEFWSDPPKSALGSFEYSNLGYMLIGVVLEEITGLSWESLLIEDLAKPLGLSTLGFGPPPGQNDPKGHRNFVVTLRPMDRDSLASDNPPWIGPAGAVHMSLADLLKYGQAHLAACKGALPSFLSQDSCSLMQTPVQDGYGFGWINQNGRIWHNGSNTMWYAVLMLDPSSDSVVAVTQNAMRRPGIIDRLAASALDQFSP